MSAQSPVPGAQERQRRQRPDSLPEHRKYQDTGCEFHSACLTCPFVRCRFEHPGGLRRLLFDEDAQRAREMKAEGYSARAIAVELGRHPSTVWRMLAG